jgi:hypothetical protein
MKLEFKKMHLVHLEKGPFVLKQLTVLRIIYQVKLHRRKCSLFLVQAQ